MRTDLGLRGSISVMDVSDDKIDVDSFNLSEVLHVGKRIAAVVIAVKKDRMTLDLSIKVRSPHSPCPNPSPSPSCFLSSPSPSSPFLLSSPAAFPSAGGRVVVAAEALLGLLRALLVGERARTRP